MNNMEEFNSDFFDKASEIWKKNKCKINNTEGVYKYQCAEICNNGVRCSKKPYSFIDDKNKTYIKYLDKDNDYIYCKLHCEKKVLQIKMENLNKKRKLK